MNLKSKAKVISNSLYIKFRGENFEAKIKESLRSLRDYLSSEADKTRWMFETYYRYSRGLASEEEMEKANKQFENLLKTLGLGVLAVLPFSPVTIPLIVRLGKRFGVEIVPDSFKK